MSHTEIALGIKERGWGGKENVLENNTVLFIYIDMQNMHKKANIPVIVTPIYYLPRNLKIF